MLSNIEALEALASSGTMLKAATRLRLTQSAISKRIAGLEARLGTQLIEKSGRRVVLTPEGRRFLERLEPLLIEFRSALQAEPAIGVSRLTLGVSESILSSWGAQALTEVQAQLPQLELELHAHRSPVVVDRVASGEYQLGLIAGFAEQASSLHVTELQREPMVLVPNRLGPLPKRMAGLGIITIEARSGTWSAIQRSCEELGLKVEREMESFFAVVQMALAGFGTGLAPWGVCQALGLPMEALRVFARTELSRPISLIARPSTMARPVPMSFQTLLQIQLEKLGVKECR